MEFLIFPGHTIDKKEDFVERELSSYITMDLEDKIDGTIEYQHEDGNFFELAFEADKYDSIESGAEIVEEGFEVWFFGNLSNAEHKVVITEKVLEYYIMGKLDHILFFSQSPKVQIYVSQDGLLFDGEFEYVPSKLAFGNWAEFWTKQINSVNPEVFKSYYEKAIAYQEAKRDKALKELMKEQSFLEALMSNMKE